MFEILESTTFKEWLATLRDRKAKLIIATRLQRLGQGLFGDAQSVGGGVNELRIHFGPGYRIYFQVRGNSIVLLLCGGDKSSQSTDIERSKSIAKQWTI
jgi:putative addiction module killer protein